MPRGKKTVTEVTPSNAPAVPEPVVEVSKSQDAESNVPVVARKTKRVVANADDGAESSGAGGGRSFKVLVDTISPSVGLDYSKGGGRYKGKMPMQAAKKAYTKIVARLMKNRDIKSKNDIPKNLDTHFTFSIQETTRGSPNNVFPYNGVLVQAEPRDVKRGGREFTVIWKPDVTAVRGEKNPETAVPKKGRGKKAAAPVEDVAPAPVAEQAPAKKGRGKKAAAPVEAAPAEVAPVEASEQAPAKKGRGKKAAAAPVEVAPPVAEPVAEQASPKKGRGKKAAAAPPAEVVPVETAAPAESATSASAPKRGRGKAAKSQ